MVRTCKGRHVAVLLLAIGLVSRAGAVTAGQATAASIIGQVTDETGAVLPGVTVSTSSPSLQVPTLSAVTDAQGEYRLAPLPIGTYQVSYELQGFQPMRRESIRLTVGFVAKLDVSLKLGGVAETITVAGTSPVVDVTSTAPASQFTKETLELIPTSRNGLLGLMAQAPGVRGTSEAGGSVSFQTPNIRVFGQVGESWNLLEGVMTTALQGVGGFGQYWDYAAMEEASVQTLGSDAEVPIRGATINGIVKGGGNEFHGTGFWGYMNSDLQSDNISSDLATLGITTGARILGRYDVSADLGGRIVKDKIWFYGGARKRKNDGEAFGAVKDDGSPASNITGQDFTTGKVSYQMNTANRFVGFWQRVFRPSTTTNQFTDWASRTNNPVLVHVWKGEWQTTHRSLVGSLQWGFWGYTDGPRISFTDLVSRMDRFTSRISGANIAQGETIDYHRWHPKGNLNWYKPDLFAGNHDFKAGFDYLSNFGTRGNISKASPNYRLIFNNGAPLQIQTFNNPTDPEQHINYFGAYVQDAWTIRRRLTLNLGLRVGRENAFVPDGCRRAADAPADTVFPATCFDRVQFKVLNNLSPRVRAAYDLTGHGGTVIKGGWGRYYRLRQIAPDIEQADPQQKSTATYRWRDLNGNLDYNPGEVNWDVNGGDFVSLAGGSNQVANPNEKTPRTDEFSGSFERQLMETMSVRMTAVYSRVTDVYRLSNLKRPSSAYNIPVVRADPGLDGLTGTADDPGTTITYFEYPAALSGRAFELYTSINDPRAAQSYRSLEVAFNRRMKDRWQFSGSYSATLTDNKLSDGAGAEFALTHTGAADNPNAEIFASNQTWDWLGRLSGAYLLPADVTLSANFEHRSGQPQARTVLFTGGVLSSITIPVEALGTLRLPVTNSLDFRVEKAFRLARSQRIQLRVNVYNVTNANTIVARTVQSGPNYLRPTSILSPRIAEFSVSYSY